MKIQYMRKPKPNDFINNQFTFGKIYEVLADYRKRRSGQKIPDDGFVIKDNNNQEIMVFFGDWKIIDDTIEKTFVFNYKK